MINQTSFKRLILRAVLRHVSPMVIRQVSVSDQVSLPEFNDGASCRRPKRIVANVVDGHPQMQALTYFANTSGVIKHFADCKIESI